VLESRSSNLYRNRKVPRSEILPYEQYLPKYNPKSRQDPEWTDIIKPTLENKEFAEHFKKGNYEMEVFTPSIK
jgi:hypothetical protein